MCVFICVYLCVCLTVCVFENVHDFLILKNTQQCVEKHARFFLIKLFIFDIFNCVSLFFDAKYDLNLYLNKKGKSGDSKNLKIGKFRN